MKRTTAIGHMVEMAEIATEGLRWRGTPNAWTPLEMWVAGELLDDVDVLDTAAVVLVLDVPPEELPWLHRHPADDIAARHLGLGKRPVLWAARPRSGPAWNLAWRRVVRYWSAQDGLDERVIDALRQRRFDDLDVVNPTPDELREQCAREVPAARAHLRAVLDTYWDQRWGRAHGRFDGGPEDVLWRAAQGLTELQDAVDTPT